MSRQLLRPHAFEVDLPLDLLSPGECHMHQDDPIPAHRQVKTSTVLALRALLGVTKDWRHARVRHIAFQFDLRARYRPRRRSIPRFEIQNNGACLNGPRKELRLNHQAVMRTRSLMTSRQHQ
jgi:hypothetical protein